MHKKNFVLDDLSNRLDFFPICQTIKFVSLSQKDGEKTKIQTGEKPCCGL